MQHFANCTVEGFITHDAVMKTTRTGKTVIQFPLAIEQYSIPDQPANVYFITIELWDDLAEKNKDRLKRAIKVMVTGYLRQDRWEDEKGKVCSRLKVVASEIRYFNMESGRYE